MPLPLLGLATGIGKKLLGGAKKTGTAVKSGAKKTISGGKFLAKKTVDKGADLAQSGVEVAKKGTTNVIKGAKFFKKKVGSVGGSISKRLKENATNIKNLLNKGNKKQDKLRAKGTERKKKKESIEKKQEKEKEVESKKSTSGSGPKNILSGLAKSPLNILDKLFGLGGILLGGILVNAAQGLIDKGKKFMEDNKELFDTVGNFLNGVKDVAKELFDSFTGPYAEEGSLDWLGKFDDLGNLQSGLFKDIEKSFDVLGGLVNDIDKALGGEGKIGNALISDKKILAEKGGKEGVLNKTTGEFQERSFTKEERQRYKQTKSGLKSTSGTDANSSEEENASVSSSGKTSGNMISGYEITSPYGPRWGRLHAGIDVGTPQGTAISLAKGGEIVAAGSYGGYGNLIDAWLPNPGIQIRLAHLSEIIKRRGTFNANQILGKTGGAVGTRGAGSSTGPHLHFEADTRKGSGAYGGSGNPKNYAKLLQLGSVMPKKTSEGIGGMLSSNPQDKLMSINQPMDDEGGETIFIQRVNTIQYVPVPA